MPNLLKVVFPCRKRQRLEDYPESKTVHKLADLIGRGKLSVCGAAELASTIVSCLDYVAKLDATYANDDVPTMM